MKILLQLQHVTRTQKATFASDHEHGATPPAIDHVEVAWDTWLEMGKPLTVTVDLTSNELEEEKV